MVRGNELTEKQRKVYQFIKDSIQTMGYPPTVREIGEFLGVGPRGAFDHLKALEKKGYLRRHQSGQPRALELVEWTDSPAKQAGRDLVTVPIVGQVAAGMPVLSEENIIGTMDIDRLLLGPGEVFALKVKGESMIEAGIHDGDHVFVKPADTAGNSEIVVAMVDGEATMKRFFVEGDHIRLQPENSSMEPIMIYGEERKNFRIIGKVISLYRRF
jgi:repressor LexA